MPRNGVLRRVLLPALILAAIASVLPSTIRGAKPERSARRLSAAAGSTAGKLLFVRYTKYPHGDIWIANGDATGQRLLIENAARPAWSPDRRQIAFVRDNAIWVVDADGKNERRVTARWKVPPVVWGPEAIRGSTRVTWDPRVARLTFSHEETFEVRPSSEKQGRPVRGCSIFDVSINPRQQYRRVHFDLYDATTWCGFTWNAAPAWSPSGRFLAFVRNGDIWVADRDGSLLSEGLTERASGSRPGAPWTWDWDVFRLAPVAHYDGDAYRVSCENYAVTRISWSPDEERLAYAMRRLEGTGFERVRVVRLGVDQWKKLAVQGERTVAREAYEPCFSPDGQHVAYNDGRNLWVVSVDGEDRHLLVRDADEPAW